MLPASVVEAVRWEKRVTVRQCFALYIYTLQSNCTKWQIAVVRCCCCRGNALAV